MPCLITNLDALEHNAALITHLCRQWGVHFLPVLKMTGCHPIIAKVLHSYGYEAFGVGDIEEYFLSIPGEAIARHTGPDRFLVNLFPLHRAGDVVRTCQRSAVSCLAGVQALDEAAKRQGVRHNTVLMIDAGDMREGVNINEAVMLAESIHRQRFQHVRIAGVGTTLGCLHGVCPDMENMALLQQTALDVAAALGHSLEVVSLGGSIFFEWFAQHSGDMTLGWPSGCTVEFRAGDPVLLGYDMYRERLFSEPGFCQDVFSLSATVVELAEKEEKQCHSTCLTGQGYGPKTGYKGRRKRALLDCGRLHTEISELDLALPGASIVEFSGNYTILDVTDCAQPLAVGDAVTFLPRYWAVAKAFRVSSVSKQFVGRNVKNSPVQEFSCAK